MKELTCPARVENIATVVDFVGGELDAVDCPMRPHLQIDVAIDELFTNISQPAEEREIGGLGIFLVKKTMDALRYEHRDGCNILYVEKKI